jgi:hypothetical protein
MLAVIILAKKITITQVAPASRAVVSGVTELKNSDSLPYPPSWISPTFLKINITFVNVTIYPKHNNKEKK